MNTRGCFYQTPLIPAAAHGDIEIVNVSLTCKAYQSILTLDIGSFVVLENRSEIICKTPDAVFHIC